MVSWRRIGVYSGIVGLVGLAGYGVVKLIIAPPEEPEACEKEGEVKKELCPDGSLIITHRCKDRKWVATGEVCPPAPPAYECTPGVEATGTCPSPKGKYYSRHCSADGKWVYDTEPCEFIPGSPEIVLIEPMFRWYFNDTFNPEIVDRDTPDLFKVYRFVEWERDLGKVLFYYYYQGPQGIAYKFKQGTVDEVMSRIQQEVTTAQYANAQLQMNQILTHF